MYKLESIILLLAVCVNFSFVPVEEDGCKELIFQYIKKMSIEEFPLDEKVYYMHFKILNEPSNTITVVPKEIDTKIYMSQNQIVYKTDQVSFYYDNFDSFLVIHPQAKIIRDNGGVQNKEKARTNTFANFQYQLVMESDVVSCRNFEQDRRPYKEIVLQASPEITENFKVKSMRYYFDLTTHSITKAIIDYAEGKDVKQQTYEYITMDFDYKNWNVVPVKQLILKDNGELQNNFRNYSMLDNR